MIPLPSTRQIQFLLALKQENSFHKAAKACGVTQSTISAAIQEMEATLGAPLIDRANRKRLIFTALGDDMLKAGQQVVDTLTHIADKAQRSTQLLSTPLRIGVIPTIAPYLLPKILRPLQKAFPKLSLQIHEMQSDMLVEEIEQGRIDYGLMAFPYAIGSLQHFPIHKEHFFCAAPKKMFEPWRHVTIAEIEKHPLLLLSDGHCLRDHALAACSVKAAHHHQDVSATSLSTLVQLVSEGYGVTLLPEIVVRHKSMPDTVDIIPIMPPPTREIGAVWRKKSSIEHDAAALSLAIYRIINNAAVTNDHVNPDFSRMNAMNTMIR